MKAAEAAGKKEAAVVAAKAPEEKVPVKATEAAGKAPEEKAEGIPFGNYILMDKVAMGGMAELFKARQNGVDGFKRIVAIKRILPHLAANQDFVTMFTDEAKLAAQLNHPNIGHIYELGKIEDSYFIAMEFVDGKDLRATLKEMEEEHKKMPFRASVYIARKVCSALSYAHRAKDIDGNPMGLVHRDISPQNIIISKNGEVKLVDFGIAKAITKASHTQSGSLKGKLLYMSPEQAWGKTIDLRADIFALGIVLWELLTGRRLFFGDSEMSILEKVREAVVEPVKNFRDDIPAGLERIVNKALEKDPKKRYQTCKAMQADLERFCNREWKTRLGAYDIAVFLNGLFPDIYKNDIVENLKQEPEPEVVPEAAPKEPERVARKVAEPRKEGAEGPKAPPVKTEKTRQAGQKRGKKSPRKTPPPPPPSTGEKKTPVPKTPPVPPAPEESSGVMFGDFVKKDKGGEKKRPVMLVAGIVVVAIVAVIAMVFIFKGKRAPTPPPTPTPVVKQPKVETPPVNATPKVQPPKAPPASPSAAEIAAAGKDAAGAVVALNKAMAKVNGSEAAKYDPIAWASLRRIKQRLAARMRGSKTVGQYQAVKRQASNALPLVTRLAIKIKAAKSAEAAASAEKALEAQAAENKAAEEAAVLKAKAKAEAARKAKAAAAAAAAKKIKPGAFVKSWAVDVKPKLLKSVKVRYTPLARSNGVKGTFWIRISIDETGKVTKAEIVRGPQPNFGLGASCITAAKKSRYSPAIKDGVPVKTQITYPVIFKMP